jgi:spore germination cell wall hydrolase CwlJ-like protein
MKSLLPIVSISLLLGSCLKADPVVLTILGESRCQGVEGMTAVAQCIKNRMDKRGQTATQVVLAPKQFSCWNAPLDPTQLLTESVNNTNTAKALAYAITHGWDVMPELQADHYYAYKLIKAPSWSKSATSKVIIGDHVFLEIP